MRCASPPGSSCGAQLCPVLVVDRGCCCVGFQAIVSHLPFGLRGSILTLLRDTKQVDCKENLGVVATVVLG